MKKIIGYSLAVLVIFVIQINAIAGDDPPTDPEAVAGGSVSISAYKTGDYSFQATANGHVYAEGNPYITSCYAVLHFWAGENAEYHRQRTDSGTTLAEVTGPIVINGFYDPATTLVCYVYTSWEGLSWAKCGTQVIAQYSDNNSGPTIDMGCTN